MADFELTDLDILSRRAQEWARYFEQSERQVADKARLAIALSRVREKIYGIIRRSIETAVVGTEFEHPLLLGTLLKVFSSDDLVNVDIEGTIYFTTRETAGDEQDFFDGIQAARERLGVGKGDIENRARIWKEFIYQPAVEGVAPEDWSAEKVDQAREYYNRTIEARVSAWGGTAPYWLILEHGNEQDDYAYPKNGPKNFVFKSEVAAQQEFDRALRKVLEEEGNALENAVQRFMADPESFRPGEILGQFYAQGQRHFIYVTPVKRLVGVTVRRPS